MQCIDDFTRSSINPGLHQPDFEQERLISYESDSRAERALFGSDAILRHSFGSDFAKGFMKFFRYDDGVPQPFFKRWLTSPY